jgi:ADP-ribosylglycohydrolase
MKEKAKAAVLASFAADSLALGVNWIYNTNVIDKKFGRVESLLQPGVAKFHANRNRGEHTHYGDQAMVLLESVASKKGFDLEDFAGRWRALFADYDGYVDHATKDTLAGFSSGEGPETSGSGSTDIGGAARIAPLAVVYAGDRDGFVAAAEAQTAMTHQHPNAVNSAAFFAHATDRVLHGAPPSAAIDAAAEAVTAVRGWVEQGKASAGRDTREAIAELGQACDAEGALPSVVHLVLSYEDDLKEALVENVMAGGDSAARGMLTGLLLGAYHGLGAIPGDWLSEMKARDRIVELLDRL